MMNWDIHETEAFLTDGTRCVPAYNDEGKKCWKTDDEHEWEIPHPSHDNENTALLAFATNHLPFRYNITNNRWAALYHCDNRLVVDQRLQDVKCWQCGDDTFAIAPIMENIDLQRWGIEAGYDYSEGGYGNVCHYWGAIWFGKWIHNPQRDRNPPNLTAEDKDKLAKWSEAFPNIGVYIAQNGALVSQNPGAEAKGGRDIQEKMPPDLTPDGEEFTAPDYLPSGDYWYINDRNAAARFDKQIETSDQAWNHNCGNIPITFSADTLDDLPAAPATQCQPGCGRVVISGNNVLSVFDSKLGRMDFSASSGCKLQ